MKKTLRMLSMGIMAAVSAVSFAQTNFTSRLHNPDMEKGVLGWDITFDGSDIWKKVIKDQASQPGYYGTHNACLESWRSSNAGTTLTNTSISQTVNGLPNGTYVFGAYMAASDQNLVESTRDLVEGVSIFANEAATAVATNNVQHMDTIYEHTSKFNVAVRVIDGTLKVGVNVQETSVSFVLMDNATLYYFGEMEPAAALDEMAKIDMAAMLAIADTCVANKMAANILAALNEAIASAKEVDTDAELYDGIENLGWAICQAVKSIKGYTKLSQALATAQEVAAQEWSEYVAEALATLNALIEEVEAKYEDGSIENEEIDAYANILAETAALVKLDSEYLNYELYDAKIGELPVGEEVGEYSEEAVDAMVGLLDEVGTTLAEAEEGAITAVQAIAECAKLFAQIDDLIASPNEEEEFPITIARSTELLNNKKIMKGAYLDETGLARFKSKTYTFDYPLARLRFLVKQNGNETKSNGYPFVALSDFVMYDENDEIIELTESMVRSNACYNTITGKKDGQGIAGLLDGDLTTYFHSDYSNRGPAEYHYIEVTLPEDTYYGFSFSMAARSNSEFHTGQFPAEMEIIHLSEAAANLQAAVAAAKNLKPYQGTDPGFFNADVVPFREALAAAEALVDTEASEAEMFAATVKLGEEQAKLEEAFVMPVPEKKYRIVSAYADFFKHQNVQKAMTVGGDSCLWWEDAAPDSLKQEFYLEARGNGYVIRSAAHDTYANRAGGNYKMLESATDSLMLISLGKGEFGLKFPQESNVLHPCDHNSGKLGVGWNGSIYGTGGGIFGESSRISAWGSASAGTVTSWYIREMTALPNAAKSISELNFQTKTLHVYEGVNTLILTADKECAYSDLVVYDLLGQEVPATVTVNGAVATVLLEVSAIESFSFAFTNAEGVTEVTVDGSVSTLLALQKAYDAAVAVSPVVSTEVGRIGDISEYNAALEAAEEVLASGGTDEEIQLAVAALETAVANLNNYINYPDADKTYYLISNYNEFKKQQGVDMALFTRNGLVSWSYASVGDAVYCWKFVEGEPNADGKRTFYIQNASTESFIGAAEATGVEIAMVNDRDETLPYCINLHTSGSVTLTNSNSSNLHFHLKNHSSGAGAYGTLIYWSTTESASDFRIVESEMYIEEYLKELSVEQLDLTDEYVAPAVKGTFDLFGRRIDTPTATGIYIVDGKKVVIK